MGYRVPMFSVSSGVGSPAKCAFASWRASANGDNRAGDTRHTGSHLAQSVKQLRHDLF